MAGRTPSASRSAADRPPVDVGQAVVEHNDVRPQLAERTNRGSAVGNRARDLEVRAPAEEKDERFAVDVGVLDEQEADGHHPVAHSATKSSG